MKIKGIILSILLALFSFTGINQASAANANVAGYWFMTPGYYVVNATGTITLLPPCGNTQSPYAQSVNVILTPTFIIKQAADGSLSGSYEVTSGTLTTKYWITGKVINNSLTCVITFTINNAGILSQKIVMNYTGTVTNGAISGTVRISYVYNATIVPGCYTVTASGATSGNVTIKISSSVVTQPNPGADSRMGLPTDPQATVGDPIHSVTGNMHVITPDLTIPGRALKFEFIRAYNNQEKTSGPLGYGWTHSYNLYLSVDPLTGLTKIKDEQAKGYLFADKGNGTYLSQRGEYSTLTKNSSSYTWRKKDGKQYIFNLAGKLTQIKDRNNNTISLIYNASNLLTQITDTAGRVINLIYNSQKLLTRVTDPAGRSFNYTYDSAGNLSTVTDPKGNPTTYQYDAKHNITKKTNAKAEAVFFTYDSSNRCTSSTGNNNNGYTSLIFTPANNKTTIIDSKSNQTVHYYNSDYLITKVVNPQGGQVLSTWDSNFNLISRSDELGRLTQMQYDTTGNLIKVFDALARVTAFVYEPVFNQPTASTDALGNKTTYLYDVYGNLLKVTDPAGASISYTYSIYGLPVTSINKLGRKIYFGYDTYGNLILNRDSLNLITYFSYDSAGNLIQTQDPKNNITKFAYDALNQLTQTTYADNSVVSYAYDAAGNRTSVTNQKKFTTYSAYNQDGKITSITDALGKVITNSYDTQGNLVSVRDQNNNLTSFSYDSLNRLILKTDALGYKTQYSYDLVGNRTALIDPKGQTTTYTYDALNRLTKVVYSGSTMQYAYDALGRRASMIDSQGTTTYAYDNLNRITKVTGPGVKNIISYTYDAQGNRLAMTNQDSGITKYTYDALNHLASLTNPLSQKTTYEYDSCGNISKVIYANGVATVYTYNKLNRVIKVETRNSVNLLLAQAASVYDAAGLLIKVTHENNDNISYTYDAVNQLKTELKKNSAGTTMYAYAYTYDAAKNRTSMVQNNLTTTYTYNILNQLTKAGSTTYTYDNNGNQIKSTVSGSSTVYVYDPQNRLTKITYSSTTPASTFTYDADGRKVKSTEGTTVTSYLFDGQLPIIERNSSNVTQVTYTRALNAPGGIGGMISQARAGVSTWFHNIHNGSTNVSHLTNSSGAVVQKYGFDAFGNLTAQTGSITNNYRFQTKELHPQSNLIYFGARYYDPRIGRFITPDPSGMVDGPNLYCYLSNNPINDIDPWGLCKKTGRWPKWLDLIVPGYRNYGGPIRIGPTPPKDMMDAVFQRHDMGYLKAEIDQSDLQLLYEISNLPRNPLDWGSGVNPFYANFYRSGAYVYFAGVQIYIQTINDIKSYLNSIFGR